MRRNSRSNEITHNTRLLDYGMDLQLPPIYLLSTRIPPDELHRLEDQIHSLTYDINEAEIVLGNLSHRERALFELRKAKLETVPLQETTAQTNPEAEPLEEQDGPSRKRKRIDGEMSVEGSTVKVVRLAWFKDSVEQGQVLPIEPYLIYKGRKKAKKTSPKASKPKSSSPNSIMERAVQDQGARPTSTSPRDRSKRTTLYTPSLLHQTTSEHDINLPPIPTFLTTTYSCQRPTSVDCPNQTFVDALKEVRTIRLLRGDQVGVRAYSTSIATIAAYPYPLKVPQEVSLLPGCGTKIAELWHCWKETGQLAEIREAESDTMMATLRVFYKIWGVGDVTARELYRKGWRDLDDLVEYGWNSLSRSQQIGVKYYDEFLLKIPRDEAACIGASILQHARQIDPGFEMVIVGGYRRGKQHCGDVDVMISHRDETKTIRAAEKLVVSLEKAHLITHTLTLSMRNSERGQLPLPWGSDGAKGAGLDTLDKALVVWQDPTHDKAPHRRVDIIISPWKTVGCAVLGWTGGTTFQRDIRRYCKNDKGYKFDSSGIRRRADGMWVDLEKDEAGNAAPDMETAERRVFEGLGLSWRRPDERCTG